MGCGTSKPKVCRHCRAPYSPARRSYSMPGNRSWDSCHEVSLTSSTFDSLNLDPLIHNHGLDQNQDQNLGVAEERTSVGNGEIVRAKSGEEEFAMRVTEAKTWSKMINRKVPKIVPKTPTRTPPGEPEMINAWELMEGLEDVGPLRPVNDHCSFSFRVPRHLCLLDDQPTPKVKERGDASSKMSWLELVDSDSNSNFTFVSPEFDPEEIAAFKKAFKELPPANPFHLKPEDGEKQPALASKECALEVTGEKVMKAGVIPANKIVPRGPEKLIVYFTTLRGVRKTYEDCCHVRVILKGLRVKVDERDVSMHSGFKDELKELLGEGYGGFGLPRVFVGMKHIGGAEEIRRLNEEGKLEKIVEDCELVGDAVRGGDVCEACGDIRFVPCQTCSGSCKVYYEEDYDEEECDENEHECGFQRCPDCNENGLVRCPICCD